MDVDTVELCSGLASINTQVYEHKTDHELQIVLVTTAQRVNHSDASLRSGYHFFDEPEAPVVQAPLRPGPVGASLFFAGPMRAHAEPMLSPC